MDLDFCGIIFLKQLLILFYSGLSGAPQSAASVSEAPLFFSGEMIFPFLFDIFPELEKLAVVADELAKYLGWPELYDLFQLARNEVSHWLCEATLQSNGYRFPSMPLHSLTICMSTSLLRSRLPERSKTVANISPMECTTMHLGVRQTRL